MKLKKIVKWSFCGGVIWLLVHSIVVVVDGLTDRGENADYAVVLGTQVYPDGTLSKRLEKRLDCALDLYHSGRVKGIIVSGGLGIEGHLEGDKMKDYLAAHGVPDSMLVVDNEGINSRKTADNTLRLQDSLQFKKLIVVSQFFHVTRTKMLFRKRGFREVSSASPHYFEYRDFYALFREFVAFYSQCI